MSKKTLLLLDFDGTITTKDTFPLFIKFDKGLMVFIGVFALFSPLLFLYKLKLYEGGKIKQQILSLLYKGELKQNLILKGEKFVEFLFLHNIIKPIFLEKIKVAISNQHEVCIVSASPNIWIHSFSSRVDVKCICTELYYNENNVFSGFFKTKNCVGVEKVIRIKEQYNVASFSEIIAYGNSNDDNEMFKLATKFHRI